MALTSKRGLNKKEEDTVNKVDRHIKVAVKEPRINPQIIAEWKEMGGSSGAYATPQEYYEDFYGEVGG